MYSQILINYFAGALHPETLRPVEASESVNECSFFQQWSSCVTGTIRRASLGPVEVSEVNKSRQYLSIWGRASRAKQTRRWGQRNEKTFPGHTYSLTWQVALSSWLPSADLVIWEAESGRLKRRSGCQEVRILGTELSEACVQFLVPRFPAGWPRWVPALSFQCSQL